jgi:hypothetical protein
MWLIIAGSLKRSIGVKMKVFEFIKLVLSLFIVMPVIFIISIIILFNLDMKKKEIKVPQEDTLPLENKSL